MRRISAMVHRVCSVAAELRLAMVTFQADFRMKLQLGIISPFPAEITSHGVYAHRRSWGNRSAGATGVPALTNTTEIMPTALGWRQRLNVARELGSIFFLCRGQSD